MELLSKNKSYCIYKLAKNIVFLRFESCEESNLTLARASAFYESPVFREHVPIESRALNQWFIENLGEKPSSLGFNIPAISLINYFSSHNKILTKREMKLKNILSTIDYKYLITTSKDDFFEQMTLEHEISHSLFHLDKTYRMIATRLVKKLQKIRFFASKLRSMGYNDRVLIDEMSAYTLSATHIEYMLFSKRLNEPRLPEELYIKYYRTSRDLRDIFSKRIFASLNIDEDFFLTLQSFNARRLNEYLDRVNQTKINAHNKMFIVSSG